MAPSKSSKKPARPPTPPSFDCLDNSTDTPDSPTTSHSQALPHSPTSLASPIDGESSACSSSLDSGDDADDDSSEMPIQGRGRGGGGYPRGGGGGNRVVKEPPRPDLSTLLTIAQKPELVALVSNILAKMRNQIIESFDPTASGDRVTANPNIGQQPRKSWDLLTDNPEMQELKSQMYSKQQENKSPSTNTATMATDVYQVKAYGSAALRKVIAEAALANKQSTNGQASNQDAVNNKQNANGPSGKEGGATAGRSVENNNTDSHDELRKEALQSFSKWQGAILRRVNEIVVTTADRQPGSRSSGKALNAAGRAAHSMQREPNGPKTSVDIADRILPTLYPPQPTPLYQLPMNKRTLLLHVMTLLVLSLGNYNAYSRVFLLQLATTFRIPLHVLEEDEIRIAKALAQTTAAVPRDEAMQMRREDLRKAQRGGKRLNSTQPSWNPAREIRLAEPLIAAGIGAVFGGVAVPKAATVALLHQMSCHPFVIGTLFGLYGARGHGKMMESYAKDIPDLAFFPLYSVPAVPFQDTKDIAPHERRMRLSICISGWITPGDEEIVDPWRILGRQSEVWAMRWDAEALTRVGTVLESVSRSDQWAKARKELMSCTSVPDSDGNWPDCMLKLSKIVDNPWSVGMVKAEKAANVLLESLTNKIHGERPVTLIGYGLGARVIYSCLMAMADRRLFGIVENVVLMGAPVPAAANAWEQMRGLVTGRVVNVYSENDYILGFMYRTASYHFGMAGTQAVKGVAGVENMNASAIVDFHNKYRYLAGAILKTLGWEDIDLAQATADGKLMGLMDGEMADDERKREPPKPMEDKKKEVMQPALPKFNGFGKKKKKSKLAAQMQSMSISG